MKKEVRLLLERAINSLVLSIEHFNRPWDRGRVETVLIMLDHSFEMLLKAAILHNGEKIRSKGESETYGFDKCVRVSISNKIISKEQALTLQTINGLRDAAQHYIVEVSEQQLYLHSQAGFTLFKDILNDTFQKKIVKELPERVLPISTTPPYDINTLFESEVSEIKKLLKPGMRRKKEATVKLRSLAIFEKTLRGDNLQPSENQLNKLADHIKRGDNWQDIFPGASSISFTTDGSGHNLSLRLTKKEGVPVQLVPEGTPGASVVAVKKVNELSFYSLPHKKLAKKVGITSPRLTALVDHLDLKKDDDCYKLIKMGKSEYQRYSPKAASKIKEILPSLDMDEIWDEYKSKRNEETRVGLN